MCDEPIVDDAWFVNYNIMHQYPDEANTFARVVDKNSGDIVFALDKREKNLSPTDDDVLMFYNAWAPPTEGQVQVDKLVYGHYCNAANVAALVEREGGTTYSQTNRDSDFDNGSRFATLAELVCEYVVTRERRAFSRTPW